MRAVLIRWLDATTDHGWTDPDSPLDLGTVTTVGFLLRKTRRYITVAHTMAEEGDECNGRISIPRKWVLEIRELDLKLPSRSEEHE